MPNTQFYHPFRFISQKNAYFSNIKEITIFFISYEQSEKKSLSCPAVCWEKQLCAPGKMWEAKIYMMKKIGFDCNNKW